MAVSITVGEPHVIIQFDISELPVFPAPGSKMLELGKVNFLYGSNGTGKTTLSRVLSDPSSYPSCRVTWKNDRPLPIQVYDRESLGRILAESESMPGVFSLGEESAELERSIQEIKDKNNRLEETVSALNVQRNDHEAEIISKAGSFKDACWSQLLSHKDIFDRALHGYLNSKEKFMNQVLAEHAKKVADSSNSAPIPLDILKNRASKIYNSTPEGELEIAVPSEIDTLQRETFPVLREVIVGSSNVSVAALIDSLKNSDWVRSGQQYLAQSPEQCPFCQQPVPQTLASELEIYFDQTYSERLADVLKDEERYSQITGSLISQLVKLEESAPRGLSVKELETARLALVSHFSQNLQIFRDKLREPSQKFSLVDSGDLLGRIADILAESISAIREHNNIVANLKREQELLKIDFWDYLIRVALHAPTEKYLSQKKSHEAALQTIVNKQTAIKHEISLNRREIGDLEARTTSILPIMNRINSILGSFGFNHFRLEATYDQKYYALSRPDGSPAAKSLSEGERAFVCFLYFYLSLKGSTTGREITTPRVAVFDDPVCSLDNDVLFIVSSLLKDLVNDVLDGNSLTTQVFILTHNVYFHNQVAYESASNRRRPGDRVFWLLRKEGGRSRLEKCLQNPISTTYELLWQEAFVSTSGLSVRNAMRRILESYFSLVGQGKWDDLVRELDASQAPIARALLSWANAGSHTAWEELDWVVTDMQVQMYRSVLELIFTRSGHEAHFRQMREKSLNPI